MMHLLTWFVWDIRSLIRCLSSSSWAWVRESAASLLTTGCAAAAVLSPTRDWESCSWDSLSNMNRWALEALWTVSVAAGLGQLVSGTWLLLEPWASWLFAWRFGPGSEFDRLDGPAVVSGGGRRGSVEVGWIVAVSAGLWTSGASFSPD